MNGKVEAGTELLRQIAREKREWKMLHTCVLKMFNGGDKAGLQGPSGSSYQAQTDRYSGGASWEDLFRFLWKPLECLDIIICGCTPAQELVYWEPVQKLTGLRLGGH